MTVDTFRQLMARREYRARAREYDAVLRCAALLGNDAGQELYILSHPDDVPPKAPNRSMWMRWEAAAPYQERHTALMFNAQMAFAIGRADGYVEAFEIDLWDKVHSSLREAA